MKYSELFAFLRELAPDLPESEWVQFENELQPKSYKKGSYFLEPGQSAKQFLIVMNGLFRLYYVDSDGKEFTKAFRGPTDLVAPYAEMLLDLPSRTFIESMTDSQVLVTDYRKWTALYQSHPAWERVGRRLAENHFIMKEQREFELLTLSAAERYQLFQQQFAGFLDQIPQYQIASYLGITPVALSRLVRTGSTTGTRKRQEA